jgi:pimeloyl-ACP methyl ester carboxylesterase
MPSSSDTDQRLCLSGKKSRVVGSQRSIKGRPRELDPCQDSSVTREPPPLVLLHGGAMSGGAWQETKEVVGADRDQLYELAADRLNHVFALHDKRSGEARTIPVMRLTPVDEAR